jgi:4-amino-4-deoxy-L-arabinose transferase-like glycosyltransferase
MQMPPNWERNRTFYIALFIAALAVNFAGIGVKFFTDDPGLYASIAKNLVYKKTFFGLFTYNQDWLDKPHFPFWMVYFSFKLFGISEWAYRFPALLFFILGVVYTWLLTKKYYNREVASVAVLILMTALNTMVSNTDLRAEPYLIGLITGAVYHIAALNDRFSVKHLLLAALLTAFAIMTKGIFVVVAIYGALLGQLFFNKRLKDFAQLKWVAAILLTIIFTLPELYALYVQFDLHPEKLIFGRHNVSGIRWFLWDSQFGRFVNNGPITRKSGGSTIFYLHTLLWAFAPWCLLFYFALVKNIRSIVKGERLREYYTLSGGVLLLVLFSVSRFQLPFYTNAVFPLFAIVTAPLCLESLNKGAARFRMIAEWIFVTLLPIAVIGLNMLLKPTDNFYITTGMLLFGAGAALVIIKQKEPVRRALFLTCISALFAGFYINTVFYREIAMYKGQIAAAGFVNENIPAYTRIYVLNAENNLFQFYCDRPIDVLPQEQFASFKPGQPAIFFINQASMDMLLKSHAPFKVIRSFVDYPKENVLPKFVDMSTRAGTLGQVYLVVKE